MMTVCGYMVAKERHHMADSLNCKSRQYGGNEPACRRSALSKCSCLVMIFFFKSKYVSVFGSKVKKKSRVQLLNYKSQY